MAKNRWFGLGLALPAALLIAAAGKGKSDVGVVATDLERSEVVKDVRHEPPVPRLSVKFAHKIIGTKVTRLQGCVFLKYPPKGAYTITLKTGIAGESSTIKSEPLTASGDARPFTVDVPAIQGKRQRVFVVEATVELTDTKPAKKLRAMDHCVVVPPSQYRFRGLERRPLIHGEPIVSLPPTVTPGEVLPISVTFPAGTRDKAYDLHIIVTVGFSEEDREVEKAVPVTSQGPVEYQYQTSTSQAEDMITVAAYFTGYMEDHTGPTAQSSLATSTE